MPTRKKAPLALALSLGFGFAGCDRPASDVAHGDAVGIAGGAPVGFSLGPRGRTVWRAADAADDRGLSALRRELVGRDVYGYGGIAISCRPDWTKFYENTTPVRVVAIERERGRREWLGTGNAATAPYAYDPGFIAVDPISILVVTPSGVRYPATGQNTGVGGSQKRCPAIELADWQVPVALSLHPPPHPFALATTPLRAGMTRDDVVWKLGYPNEIGTRERLRREPVWEYGAGKSRYEIRFRGDRVSSFTDPDRNRM